MPRLIFNLQPMLQTRDLRESMRFYTEILGFKIDGVWPDEAKPTWCGLASGNARIMLTQIEAGSEPQMTGYIYMYPEDVEALWAQIKDKVEVDAPLTATEYGMNEFVIHDPNGYHLSFGNSLTAEHDHTDGHDHPHDH
jgi:uncharacterized glyoxalase superfamily protein PhnB